MAASGDCDDRDGKPPAAGPLAEPDCFRRRLIRWFEKCGRDYPWRRTADPYAILVSEVMLQQTRIATVLERGYYRRWMEWFPDVATLATAPEDKVLLAWEGLGYYSRARNLQRAAVAIVRDHAGVFPRRLEEIRALPGAGRYTAAAVASFAWNAPEPLVDGNVVRIFARLMACDDPVDDPGVRERIWEWAAALVSRNRARLYNSALMELGQRICTPGQPACGECPVRRHCASFGGDPASRPRKAGRRATVEVTEHAVYVRRGKRVLLQLETGSRRRGLWRLPFRSPDGVAADPPVLTTSYSITHHRVRLVVHRPARIRRLDGEEWHPVDRLAELPMPGPFRRVLNQLLEMPAGRR